MSESLDIPGRIEVLLNALPPACRGRVTMAVADVDDAGQTRRLIATSEPRGYLRPGVTPERDETLVPGMGHAEQDIIDYATRNNMTVRAIGATRPICERCAAAIVAVGATAVTPIKTTGRD